ncbi:cardioacceleratory peptide receptor-like isoform X1 [Neocloeon triangulifer]|uniref:cardioacceleratory peptide receptor-like isoform X1 n=2 Tax=Neocloeon triangulifer TaxID=2078957 RepID=UPI00286F0643|nr:cardioacceleratory peptide receptor-like isoform X1 [Neocloeon triangulifer]
MTSTEEMGELLASLPTAVFEGATNDTANDTFARNDSDINQFYFYETEQFIVLWLLFILILVGNSAVLAALLLDRTRAKSRMNFFIMHLAIADLSVGLINVLTDIVSKHVVSWYAGNVACKFIKFLQALVTYASTYVLVALSIDRYDAIRHPMNFSGSWRRARILIATAWMLSALFSAPIMFLFEERLVQEQPQCWIELSEQWHWQLYITLLAVVLFFIPACIITFCYTVIVATIWAQGKVLGTQPARSAKVARMKTPTRTNGHTEEEADCRRASSRGLIPRAKIKTVKMTLVIVFVFILCWSPYFVFDLLQVYEQVPRTQTTAAVATFIQSLAPLNSAANPVIYCLFSSSICRSLRKLPPLVWIPFFRRGTDTIPPGALSSSSGWRNVPGVPGSRDSTSLSELASRSSSSNAYNRSTCKGSPRTIAASRRML